MSCAVDCCCLEEESSVPFEQNLDCSGTEEANVALSHFSIAARPGSYLAQIRIAREEFLFSVACNSSLSFPISKFVGVQSMCFGVATALLFQWIRESWKRCFPMPGNSSCCIRTTFLLLLSFSSLFVFLLLYVWIFSPLSYVARRCSGIADHTSSLQKYSSHRTCKAVSGRSSGFFCLQSTTVSFVLEVRSVWACLLWKSL